MLEVLHQEVVLAIFLVQTFLPLHLLVEVAVVKVAALEQTVLVVATRVEETEHLDKVVMEALTQHLVTPL